MLRVRLDFLQDQAGRLHYRGKPFDGIAYQVRGHRVVANRRVAEGVPGGPAEAWPPDRPRALIGALTIVSVEETDERFPHEGGYLDGVLFDGVAYAFDADTGILVQEQDLHPTDPGPSREWYPSGALQSEFGRPRPDGGTECETWHQNGRSAGIESRKVGFSCTSEGRLNTLQLERDFPESDLERVPFAADSRLFLSGPGVTDEIVERLEGVSRIERLVLHRTNVSARGLGRFRVCGILRELETEANTRFSEDDVRELLSHLPGCEWRND
jgi:hypothetical protein